MTRNREFFRWMNLARTSPSNPLEADRPHRRRRALRRVGLAAALAAAALIVAQVVLAVPPTNVSFTVEPSSPTRGQVVTFTASDQISDPDGGTITSYDWNFGDGTTASGPSPSVQHTYANSTPAGEKTVTLRVTDSNMETTEVSQPVQVVNVGPTAAVSCSPSTVAPNQATTCNSTGSGDTEGPISYAWDIDGDGFDDGTDASEQFSFGAPGPKMITLRVTDSDNATATDQDTVTVSNATPTARFTVSPANPTVNQPVEFNGSGSTDPEGEPLTYEWDLDGDGQFDDGTGATITHPGFATGGNHTVQLRVTDPQNNSDTETQIVTVGNTPPSASFNFSGTNSVTPAVPDVNEPIDFISTATDPNGNGTITSHEWDLDYNGTTFTADRVGANIQHSFSTPGNKRIALRVTDSSGASNTADRTVRVNALPVARPSSLNPQAESGQKYNVPLINQPILFTGGAVPQLPGAPPAPGCPASGGSPGSQASTDAEGAIAKYEWDLDGDGIFETDRGTNPDAPYPGFPTAGDRTAVLRVTDSDGATAQATLQFRVNTAPTAAFVFEPLTPIIGEEVTFGSTASDPDAADSGKHIFSWDLDNDGTFCEAGETGGTVKRIFPTANTSPGHPVTLRVTDDGGITRPVTRNVVVQNTVPRGSIGFSPDAPLPTEPVTFNGSASSPSGKPIQSMEWDFDFPANFDPSTQTFEANASGSTVSQAFSTAGPKRVGLKIQEQGGGFAIVTATVVVNSPPRAGFTVSPPEAFVGDGVTLSSTSSDLDNPIARQDWDLDNDGQFDDANAAVVSANFTRAGTYPLALRVTDSRGATSTATGQVVIRTRPILPPPPTPLLSGVVIEGRFLLFRRDTKVKSLRVRAPAGSKISVRCLGKKNCPKPMTKTSKGSKKLPFKKLQRKFRPKTKLIITVTKSGFIGRQTTFTMRRRKPPLRRDLCLNPGAKTATPCPSG
jgi:PKD repeat protein